MEEGHAVIRKAVLDVLGAHGIDAREVRLMPIEPPRAWGLSTNVCMQLGPQVAREEIELKTEGLGKKEAKQVAAQVSREVSEKLAEHLAEELQGLLEGEGEVALPYVTKVEAEGAYVNFYYDAPALAAHVVERALGKTYGALDAEQRAALLKDAEAYGHGAPTGKRIMVEYAQPNTHKDFHVGHLRNASIGQAIANLLEFAGNDVLKATYIGDIGKHVAVAIWAKRTLTSHKYLFVLDKLEKVLPELKDGEYSSSIRRLMTYDHQFFGCDRPECNERWGVYYSLGVRFFSSLSNALFEYSRRQESKVVVNLDPDWQFFYFFSSHFDCQIASWLQDWEEETRLVESVTRADKAGDIAARDKARQAFEYFNKYREPQVGRSPWTEWMNSRNECMNELEDYFKELIITFDKAHIYSEYGVERSGLPQQAAEALKALGIAEVDESEKYKGALYVDFEKHVDALRPDGTPVFRDDEKKRIRKLGKMTILRSDGTSLYQTKELGLAKHKFDLVRERFGSDLDESLYVVGAEQKLYFDQVFAILRLWGFPNAENCKHISYELVVLPEGKMSSREGNIVSYRDLRDEAIKRAIEITTAKGIAGDVAETAHDIAIAAIKYAMLQVTGNQQIVFDFEQALSFSGRAAPYLQYAYARAGKLVAGDLIAGGAGVSPADSTNGGQDARPTGEIPDSFRSEHNIPGYELHPSELMLARVLGQFPAVCADAAAHYEPATLCTYLYDLATAFSDFYRDCRVLDADEPMRTFRTRLCAAFRQVMRTGFAILALPLPEEM